MSAFNIIKSDDGLSYRIEWDAHYITDEQIGTIGAYVGALQEENEKLRELVKDMVLNIGGCALHGNPLRLREFNERARELGVEV